MFTPTSDAEKKMTPREEHRKQVSMLTNLAYVVVDMLQTASMEMNEGWRKADLEMRFEQKVQWNRMNSLCKQMLRTIRDLEPQRQIDFGQDSDCMWMMVKLLISRSGADYLKLYKFYEYIKSFPEILPMYDLKKNEDNAFGFLFEKSESEPK